MTRYRVTISTRDTHGLEYATIHGPFDGRGDAARFAQAAQAEDGFAVVDVVPLTDNRPGA